MKAKPFVGDLAKPIPVRLRTASFVGDWIAQSEIDADKAANGRELQMALLTCMERLPLLFAHYEIPDNPDGTKNWIRLAFSLALDSDIPGFQYESRSKPGRKDNFSGNTRLLVDVMTLQRRHPTWKDGAAISYLVRQKRGRWAGRPVRSVHRNLRSARQVWKQIFPKPPELIIDQLTLLVESFEAEARAKKLSR